MRIAVASENENAVAQHFGRCAFWTIIDVEAGVITGREVRRNLHTAHALENCHGGDHQNHNHSHGNIVSALRDCECVLCAGIGWRAATELEENGIPPFIVGPNSSPAEAVRRHLAGESVPASQQSCAGHHGGH